MKTSKFACKGCGIEVERVNKQLKRGGRFCSARCFYSSKTKSKSRICKQCGITFSNVNALMFCSRTCFDKRVVARRKRVCVQCGNNFDTPRPGSAAKLCSRECVYIHHRKPSEIKPCAQCGTSMTVRPMGKRTRKFCGKECALLFKRGNNHPLFRGDRRRYRGANWYYQAGLARDRDGGVCQGCGSSDAKEKASVDHVVPFRMTVVYGKSEGKDPNDLRNLMSLCRSCHARKTQAESKLLRGDMIGFRDAVKSFLPMDKVESALKFWGF